MPTWDGWSTDERQVVRTRILGELLANLTDDDGLTAFSVAEAMQRLGITPQPGAQPGAIANEFARTPLFDGELSLAPARDQLIVLDAGRQAAQEFRDAANRRRRSRACRRALLMWIFDRDRDPDSAHQIQEAPESWYYGRQFTEDELTEAGRDLLRRNYITGSGTLQGPVLRPKLSPRGEQCVEYFDGDPTLMEAPRTENGPVTNNYQSAVYGGNVNLNQGGTNVTQTITIPAGDEQALYAALRDTAGISEDDIADLAQAIQQDRDDARTTAEPGPGPRIVSWLNRSGVVVTNVSGKIMLGGAGAVVGALAKQYLGL